MGPLTASTLKEEKKQVGKEGGQHDAISPLQTPKDKSSFSSFQSGLVVANAGPLPCTPHMGTCTKRP